MVSASLAVSLRAGQDSMETLLGGETLRTVYAYTHIYIYIRTWTQGSYF